MFKTKIQYKRFSRLIFLWLACSFAFVKLGFLAGLKLNFIISIIVLIASLTASNLIIGLKKDFYKLNISFILFITIILGFSTLFIDLTFDGQAYHQESVIQMSNQWNPLYENINESNNQSLWVNHYARAYEIIGALFFSIFNSIKVTKAINLIFIFVVFFYTKKCASSFSFTNSKSIKVALLVTFNPILITQLTTNLIDGFLYGVSIITICSFLLIKRNKNYTIDFILGLLLLINIKFTGLVFGVFIYGILSIYSFNQGKKFNKIFKESLILLFLVLPFVVTPYLKNMNQNGHPFYPLMGKEKVDFVEDYVPDVLLPYSNVKRIVVSSFLSIGNRADARFKIPFTFTRNELQKLRNGGARVGDFGPWWGGILIISIIFYLYNIFRYRKKFKISIFEISIFTIILLMFLNKAGWWLRYTPYFWLIPLGVYFSISRLKKSSIFLNVLLMLVVVNSLLIFTVSIGVRYLDSMRMHKKLVELKKVDKVIYVDFDSYLGNKELFKDYNINYIEKNADSFSNPSTLNNVVIIETND